MAFGIKKSLQVSFGLGTLITGQKTFLRQQGQVSERSDVELRRRRFRFGENSVHDAFIAQPIDVHFYKRIFFLESIGEGLASIDVQGGIPTHGSPLSARLGK